MDMDMSGADDSELSEAQLAARKAAQAKALAAARQAEAARNVAPLAKLWLNGNGIGAAGAAWLAQALAVNSSLRSLVLSENEIGDEGAVLLVEAVARSNRTLSELHLDDNPIGAHCHARLTAAFDACPTLLHLSAPGLSLHKARPRGDLALPIAPERPPPPPVWRPAVALDAFAPTASTNPEDDVVTIAPVARLKKKKSMAAAAPEVQAEPPVVTRGEFCSITAMPVHEHLSFEELRVRQMQVRFVKIVRAGFVFPRGNPCRKHYFCGRV